jgi:acyl-coenzyme A thioesterase PaaI-like protein
MTRPVIVGEEFADGIVVRPLGDGTFAATLPAAWTVGQRPHGGFLLALIAKCGLAMVPAPDGQRPPDPIAVSAQFLAPPEVGPVLLRTDIRKSGRTAGVISVHLEQRGRSCVEATLTTGRLPAEPAVWSDLPKLAPEPPANAIDLAVLPAARAFKLATVCDVRLDPADAGFLEGRVGDPLRLRMWARPKSATPDPLFALVAGDISPPVTFNLGRYGWSPTVQLTALLRSRPDPGWFRIEATSRAVHGAWFDEDTLVIDSAGKLVCQSRQLALTPLDR